MNLTHLKRPEPDPNYYLTLAASKTRKNRNKDKERYDRNKKFTELTPGTKVLLKALRVSKPSEKIYSKFLDVYERPYKVEVNYGNGSYLLTYPNSKNVKGKFNIKDLKLFVEEGNEVSSEVKDR